MKILKVTSSADNTAAYLNADIIRGFYYSKDKKGSVILFNNGSDSYLPIVEDIETVLRRLSKLYPEGISIPEKEVEPKPDENAVEKAKEAQKNYISGYETGLSLGTRGCLRIALEIFKEKFGLSYEKIAEIREEIEKEIRNK